MAELRSMDVVAACILAAAMLRGVWLGLIRESFSIAALGGACVAVRLFHAPLAGMLVDRTDLSALWAPWLAGAAVGIGTIAAVAFTGRLLRRGARAAGLGWADRAGGAVLGVAEGALVAGVLLVVAIAALGRDHPLLEGTRSLAALADIERLAGDDLPRIDVAAPPR